MFDGWEQLPEHSPFPESLEAAISELPSGGRLFVTARREPSPQLMRDVAHRNLDVISGHELHLRPSEAMALARSVGSRLSRDRVRALHEQCGGWIAGFLMLLQTGEPPGAHLDRAPETVETYLQTQVYQHLDAATRRLLVRSSPATQLTAPLVEAMARVCGAREHLDRLVRHNAFVESRPGNERLFELHPLFRAFLLGRFSELAVAEQREICRRGAACLRRQSRLEEAVALLRLGGDADAVAEAVEEYAPSLIAQRRAPTLREWLEGVAEERIRARPRLDLWRAVSEIPEDGERAVSGLTRAYALREAGDTDHALLAICSILGAQHYWWHSPAEVRPWLRELASLLPAPHVGSLGVPEIRALASLCRGLCIADVLDPALPELVRRADAAFRARPSERVDLGLATHQFHVWRGDLEEAAVNAEILERVAARGGVAPVQEFALCTAQAIHAWHVGDAERNRRAIERGEALSREASDGSLLIGTFAGDRIVRVAPEAG